MILISPLFGGLCLILLIVGRLRPVIPVRLAVLLLVNLAFIYLAAGEGKAAWPAFAVGLLGYGALFLVRRSRLHFAISIVVIVAVFMYLKRYPIFDALPLAERTVSLIGVSYVLFRTLHVVIDFAEGSLPSRPSFVSYLNYNYLFLSFLSGPIHRYEDFVRSAFLVEHVRSGIEEIGRQVARIVSGIFKILFVSGLLEFAFRTAVEGATGAAAALERGTLGAASVLLFAMFLYANFSGYMDMVVAVGKLLGLRLPENFDRPFSAANIQELWQRWHITLSQWIRTYLFSPLLLFFVQRAPEPPAAARAGLATTFVAFFTIGIWHSSDSAGFIYGVLLGGGAVAHRLWRSALSKRLGSRQLKVLDRNYLYRTASCSLTLTHFFISIVCLWPSDLVGTVMARFEAPEVTLAVLLIFAFVAALVATTDAARRLAKMIEPRFLPARYLTTTARVTAQLIILLIASLVVDAPVPGFVYQAY